MATAEDNDDNDILAEIFADSDSEESEFEGFDEDDFPLAHFRREEEGESSESEEDDDDCEAQWIDAKIGDALPGNLPNCLFEPGLHTNLPENPKPLDFFKLYYTEEMLELVVKQTNLFATQTLQQTDLRAKSRMHMWKELSVPELKVFIALIFAMGLSKKQDIQDYWSQDEVLSTPFFSKYMSRDRFLLIMKFLHLNDNTSRIPRGQNGYDALFKIRPFYKLFQSRLENVYQPEQNLSIDESTIGWKGNLHFRVYNPNKSHKFHIKAFVLAEAESGLILRYEIYTGKSETEASEQGATYDIVFKLLSNFLDAGYRVFMDNYYSGVPLFEDLYQRSTPACGTVRLNRKNLPNQLKQKLKKGEMIAYRKNSLLALKWKDKRDVCMLSTMHTSSMKDSGKVNRNTEEAILKPEAVLEYNKYMGGVDQGDQLWQYFGFSRITRKAYKKMYFHIQHICEVQAYIIYKKLTADPVLHRTFCLQLIKDLILDSGLAQKSTKPGRRSADATELPRLTGRHFPSDIIAKEGAKRKKPFRKCHVCWSNKRRKETCYQCTECGDIPLCVTPCFEQFHTLKNF